MTFPDEILKAQRSLSVYSGTKTIALGLITIGLTIGVFEVVEAFVQKESVLRAFSSGLMITLVAVLLRETCTKRIRELNRVLKLDRA